MNAKVPFFLFLFLFSVLFNGKVESQSVPVGSGSYTTVFPGVDVAGRNSYPSGNPLIIGNAANKPVPTNDWWSAKLKNDHVSNLFSYPNTLKTVNSGLVMTYIPWGVIDDQEPLIIGLTSLNATRVNVSDYSDWTFTMNWANSTHSLTATAGIAMPFVYFSKNETDVVQITVNEGSVTVNNEMLVIENVHNGADFAIYAPSGSVWDKNGKVYTSTLNNKNYWSVAHLPSSATSVQAAAETYKKYAYVFPANTVTSWNYNENTSVVRTDFTITPDVKEGDGTTVLQGLLPHQWNNLAADSPVPAEYSYASIRGEIKTLAGNSFSVENTFYGILPTLPYVDNYSEGFSPPELNIKVQSIENDGLSTWTDSYNEGQMMNRLIQTARIADLTGNTVARDKMLATVKERLEDWLTYEAGEVAFLFYYNTIWSAMIGYPAGHGQDGNLNDHHFHWGYFIHAAAFLEQFEPGWASKWGEMINLLVRDAASPNREDEKFPFLRNYSPYAGHCWANGFATFPQGNDQESTSESMQFNSSLIHWGTITGNDEIRDLGIYLYTTEQTAIEEYWFDMYERNFAASQQYSLVSRVWGNSYDNGTFWTSDIAASYGIEMYPIHGGSLYLGHNTDYVEKLWNEITQNTGILENQANDNLWHDVMWEYLAFIDPAKAIELYDSYPERNLKFGISDAQTYYWLHAMNALGKVDVTVTADYPIAAVFEKDGSRIYTAHNYSNEPVTVTFSDGFKLEVPAGKMVTSLDGQYTGVISTLFQQAYVGGSAELNISQLNGTPDKIEFMDGTVSLGTVTSEPYTFKATNLQFGVHTFYARIYDGEKFSVTNNFQVQVGEQIPYNGIVSAIPGIIEAGKYDQFEGGSGQNIAYLENSTANMGDFRMDESVDASNHQTEGAVVENIASGEWLEYTVNVEQSGYYSMTYRYASGNSKGGGPFHLELDGQIISPDLIVASTSTTSWNVWASKTVNSIPLTSGEHVLRVAFSSGEFNLGKMTFALTGDLDFSYPTAIAGNNIKVVLPQTEVTLDGSASSESTGKTLTYEWSQIYGPTEVIFSDPNSAKPVISGLAEGMYRIKLKVTNTESRFDEAEVLVLVTNLSNAVPSVSLTSPSNNSTFTEGNPVTITASASDFDGTIQQVDFYVGNNLISTAVAAPFSVQWNPAEGNYEIIAKARDNEGAESYSNSISVIIAPLMRCSESSKEATQGSFSEGYIATFETVGTDVTITFELLDSKAGSVAYLWKQSPFSESQMTNIGGKKFTATISGQTPGSTISYACKFAYSGGMSVTKYISYKVGSNCGTVGTANIALRTIQIYPNPVVNELTISNIEEKAVLSIYDLKGNLLMSKIANSDLEKIDVSNLSTGLYFIKVVGKNFTTTSKLIKQ